MFPSDRPQDGITVGTLATALGVTVRTLHHWDELGLASPSRRDSNGYRVYDTQDISRIQRVLIYRDLGVPLEQIRELLDQFSDDVLKTLRHQREAVERHLNDTRRLLSGLDRMIAAQEHGIRLCAEQQMEIFGPEWNPQWPREARQRWGDSPQWTEYAERAAGRSREDWASISVQVQALETDLVTAMAEGLSAQDPSARELAERHRASIKHHFSCTYDRQVLLGRMYVSDPAFKEHYDRLAPGLAAWLLDAIEFNAHYHGVNPDSAEWD